MKIKNFLLSILMLACISLKSQSRLIGDINNDGNLTVSDVASLADRVITNNLEYVDGVSRKSFDSLCAVMRELECRIGYLEAIGGVVPPVFVKSIDLGYDEIVLNVGDTFTFEATVLPANATCDSLAWISGDEEIARPDGNGTFTILSRGITTITAKSTDGAEVRSTCKIVAKYASETTEKNVKLYFIEFNDNGTSENSSIVLKPESISVDSIVKIGEEYIAGFGIGPAATTTRAYLAKLGFGLKIGNSKRGNLSLLLTDIGKVKADSIKLLGCPFTNSQGIESNEATLNGTLIGIDNDTIFKYYTIKYDTPQQLDSLYFSGLSQGRYYIKQIIVYYTETEYSAARESNPADSNEGEPTEEPINSNQLVCAEIKAEEIQPQTQTEKRSNSPVPIT